MRNKIIYIGIAIVLAFPIYFLYDEFTFSDSLFMVAVLRFLFNLLGLLSNSGAYDSPKYLFHVMRKKVIQKEDASSFEDFVSERRKSTNLGFKMLVNATLMLLCIIASIVFY